jgi:hypothetical protein
VKLPKMWLQHTITVEPYKGTGSHGAVYGPAQPVDGFLEERTRLVRAPSGDEVTSSSTFYCRHGASEVEGDAARRAEDHGHPRAPGERRPAATARAPGGGPPVTQYARMSWEGNRLWNRRGRRLASEGLTRALEHTLGVSKRLVPLDEGPLERSGRVNVNGLDGFISYDTIYAVRQHEELTWKHLPGRQAKYLEQPMNTERDVMLRLMAVPLRRWLRG